MASDQRANHQRFRGDRYQRLRQGADVLAADPAMAGDAFPFNGRGAVEFARNIAEHRMLDDLTDDDADLVAMHLLMDFPGGPAQVAWRLQYWLSPVGRAGREQSDVEAIAAVFEVALTLMIDLLFDDGVLLI